MPHNSIEKLEAEFADKERKYLENVDELEKRVKAVEAQLESKNSYIASLLAIIESKEQGNQTTIDAPITRENYIGEF